VLLAGSVQLHDRFESRSSSKIDLATAIIDGACESRLSRAGDPTSVMACTRRRPIIWSQPGDHPHDELKDLKSGHGAQFAIKENGVSFVTYRPMVDEPGASPSDQALVSPRPGDVLLYELLDFRTLWARRHASPFDKFRVNAERGTVGWTFPDTTTAPGEAHPPWAWRDEEKKAVRRNALSKKRSEILGDWFLDPLGERLLDPLSIRELYSVGGEAWIRRLNEILPESDRVADSEYECNDLLDCLYYLPLDVDPKADARVAWRLQSQPGRKQACSKRRTTCTAELGGAPPTTSTPLLSRSQPPSTRGPTSPTPTQPPTPAPKHDGGLKSAVKEGARAPFACPQESAALTSWTVRPGDSFWRISRCVFGWGRDGKRIALLEPNLQGSRPRNPTRLRVGSTLRIPRP
jgi:hypothetical protein